MCMNGDFQHVHFLTTRTMINEISKMLSLVFPSVIQILETFKCTFKCCAACQLWNIEMDSVYMTQYVELIRYILVNILSASQSYHRHKRERESAISLSTPGMNSSEKLNSDNAMYHRTIIGFEASVMNNKFR